MIDGEQGRMLASLLEKPFNHVVVNKLLENQNNIRVLTCDPEKVKEKTKEFFQNQFRRRCFDSDTLGEEWAQVYAPLERVQEKWFEALDKNISEEEWEGMLKYLKRNTAPGVSGITYTLIKAADNETQKVFRSFAGLCIQLGRIPTKWKVSQIYPIPKDANWGYDLGNVRPIALLKTFRKCTTKIYTKRLSQIIQKKNILKGPNFAGLTRGSTETPVHIINALMEDAKENKKELWLVLQDMKKAFDLVSLVALDLALTRLKIPKKHRSFIINLFYKRESRVITAVGCMESFTIEDDIEKGELISPLVWRIFYDPLLECIQSDTSLGYKMAIEEPYNLKKGFSMIYEQRQSVVAFADDTTW